jgi:hypothetical protein
MEDQLRSMVSSRSWRLTRPLRWLDERLRGRDRSPENPPEGGRSR